MAVVSLHAAARAAFCRDLGSITVSGMPAYASQLFFKPSEGGSPKPAHLRAALINQANRRDLRRIPE